MKCVMCRKGNLAEKTVEYKEFGVSLGCFKAKVCSSCEEQFFDKETAKKIQEASREAGLFGLPNKARMV